MSLPLEPTPIPAAELERRRPSPLLELLLFLLLAATLFFAVQAVAITLFMVRAQQQQPGVPWDQLSRQVAERLQYNVGFLVPVQIIYYVLLLLVLWLLVCRLRGETFQSGLAFHSFPAKYILLAAVAGLFFAPLIQFANLLVPPPEPLLFDKLFTSQTAVLLLLSLAVLVAPLMEELIFLGYLYGLLERLWGENAAVLLSGFLFGSIHFYQLSPGYFQMALICIVGIVFSAVRARTGTVVAAIAVHFGYNLSLSLLYFLSPHFRNLPP
ncbi:MAG: lysostaphin resistance A-like protein [Candidatus Acidiferrales bacterium]